MDYGKNTLDEFKELILPEMSFQVEVKKATIEKYSSGAKKLSLNLKAIDTIPAGQEIDTETYKNPLVDGGENTTLFADIWLPTDLDDKGKVARKIKGLKRWIADFEVDNEGNVDEKELAKRFVGTCGGIVVKDEAIDRDDPEAGVKSRVAFSTAVR